MLAERVFGELHRIAAGHMRRERRGHTLQTTALVNEAYVRLVRDNAMDWQGRAHFFAAASIAMRRILVDYARRRSAGKRPNAALRVDWENVEIQDDPKLERMLALDEAMDRLAVMDARQARIVELRYFGGLSEEEIAEVLSISLRTVKRDWRSARAWLQAQLNGEQ